MALVVFTPSAYATLPAQATSSSLALPGGGGTALLITNIGPNPAAINLSTGAGTVAMNTGVVLCVGQSIALAVGSFTFLNAVSLGYGSAVLNIAQGV